MGEANRCNHSARALSLHGPVGILALQGDFEEHAGAFRSLGAVPRLVRRPEDLDGLTGLVVPGGESTVMSRLLRERGLGPRLLGAVEGGLPLMGTCAGAILLSREVPGHPDLPLGLADLTVRRNGYGRQLESFSTPLEIPCLGSPPLHAVFIRAPRFLRVGNGVEVLATHEGDPVMVRQDLPGRPRCLLLTFHPELTGDTRIHRMFLEWAVSQGPPAGAGPAESPVPTSLSG